MSPSTDQRDCREFASEIKFLIPRFLAAPVREWAANYLVPDPNVSKKAGDSYRITSVYLDTEEFDVFHRRGSYGRSKLRIRRYGLSDEVFLERKLKTRGLLAKRRSLVDLADLDRLVDSESRKGWRGEWFHRRILARRLQPICQITYLRTARVAMTCHGPIRLTLDHDVRARALSELAFKDASGLGVLPPDTVVLELKFRVETPAIFKRFVQEFALNSQPVSKYRLAVTTLGCATPAASTPAVQGNSHLNLACSTF